MTCFYCEEPILPDEPYRHMPDGDLHRECLVRISVGSAEHIEKRCCCYMPEGAAHDEPANRTTRESAKRAERALVAQAQMELRRVQSAVNRVIAARWN